MSLVKTTRKEESVSTGVTEGVTPELLRTVLSATLQEKQPDIKRDGAGAQQAQHLDPAMPEAV